MPSAHAKTLKQKIYRLIANEELTSEEIKERFRITYGDRVNTATVERYVRMFKAEAKAHIEEMTRYEKSRRRMERIKKFFINLFHESRNEK